MKTEWQKQAPVFAELAKGMTEDELIEAHRGQVRYLEWALDEMGVRHTKLRMNERELQHQWQQQIEDEQYGR